MATRVISDDLDQALDVVFKPKKRLEWVVREDPKLQAELNKHIKAGEELSPKVVAKVLDRIKEL